MPATDVASRLPSVFSLGLPLRPSADTTPAGATMSSLRTLRGVRPAGDVVLHACGSRVSCAIAMGCGLHDSGRDLAQRSKGDGVPREAPAADGRAVAVHHPATAARRPTSGHARKPRTAAVLLHEVAGGSTHRGTRLAARDP